MQKGQITIFIIAGLTVLIIFGGLMYIRNSSTNLKLAILGQQLSQQEMLPARAYVEETTRQTLLDGIWLMGKQGGKLYKDQGGLSDYKTRSWIQGEDNRIATGIEENERDAEDAYPDEQMLGGGTYYWFGRRSAELPTLNNEKEDMEKQLNEYMKNKLLKNLDFKDIKDYKPVKKGIKDVKVKINQRDITAAIEYDLVVEKKGVEGQIKTVKAQAELNLNNLYYFNRYIIKQDTNDLNFDIQEDGSQIDLNGRKYKVIRKMGDDYDIITIQDNTISHYGKPFEYRWIRQNRAPDASTVHYFGDLSGAEQYAYYGLDNTYRLICGYPTDPDEDAKGLMEEYERTGAAGGTGMYSFTNWLGITYPARFPDNHDLYYCGNFGQRSKDFVPLEQGQNKILASQVCSGTGPTAIVKDHGGLQDKYTVKDQQIRCTTTLNPECCDGDPGCWKKAGSICEGGGTIHGCSDNYRYDDSTGAHWCCKSEADFYKVCMGSETCANPTESGGQIDKKYMVPGTEQVVNPNCPPITP